MNNNTVDGEFIDLALNIIAKRWPQMGHALKLALPLPDAHVALTTPFPCLIVHGIHMSSAYDPEGEARLQATLVPPSSRHAWLYGLGGGALARELLRSPGRERLDIVFFNFSLTKEVLARENHRDWLEDPRVQLHYAEDMDNINTPFTVSPACLHLADRACCRLRDQILLELSNSYIDIHFAERKDHLQQQIEANKSMIATDPDVRHLFASLPGAVCVVAGAGPTLAQQYHWMQQYRGRFTLVAVDASLVPLAEHNIIPDMAVAIESSPILMRFFNQLPRERYRQVPLVYFPQVYNEVISRWPGPRYCAWPTSSAIEGCYPLPQRARLFSGGSVIHPATDLAVKLGSAKVIFVGADFALPGQRSHVAGCSAPPFNVQGARDTVLNGHGDMVVTVPGLRGFLRDLERYIQKNTSISFLNSSRDGALIHDTTYLEEGFWHEA